MSHPQRIGKYPITAVLGEGAMGVVYRAEDPVIGRAVAIKTVHKRLLADEAGADFAARFRNEARSAGQLSHPHIVAVHEYGEDADSAYIVMEFVEGRTLAQQLGATPLPAETDLLRWMNQLLDALDCAHRHGVWHRDIKPANLIVTPAGQLKVTDFGIARIASAGLTQTGLAIGTPGYMAPEQYLGETIDQRVDIFAAGVLLYRLLAGRPPFSGTAEAVMYQLFHETPPPPSQVDGSGRDARFDAIVARAMARDPADRFASAADFRLALAAAATGEVGDQTVVRPRAGAPAVGAPAVDAHATGVTGWDAAALAPVEAALATLIGPLAKVLVRQAARGSQRDLGLVATRVAEHIADAAQRRAFVARFAITPTAATAVGRIAPADAPATPLPTALVEHATRVLTTHMGPIARIVVKKAWARSSSREEFLQRLVDETGAAGDPVKLRADLERGG